MGHVSQIELGWRRLCGGLLRRANRQNARAGIGAIAFVAAATSVLARGVTTWRRVMKNTALLVAVLALASALACESADASTYDVSFSLGATNVTGTIVTDCDSCVLTPADITSFSFTFTGFLNASFSGNSSNVGVGQFFSPSLSAGNGIIDFIGGNEVFEIQVGPGLFEGVTFGLGISAPFLLVLETSVNLETGFVVAPFQIATQSAASPAPS
jgi:hypothetical protein